MRLADYQALGGHMSQVRTVQEALARGAGHRDGAPVGRRTIAGHRDNPWPLGQPPMLG
jgi:hypothetical protein